jgi:hypothetical protein
VILDASLNVCRNISDGVSPFIRPCFLLSLSLANISYLSFPSSILLDMCSAEMSSFLTILLYASTFYCNRGWESGIGLSFMLLCSRKRLRILDVNYPSMLERYYFMSKLSIVDS